MPGNNPLWKIAYLPVVQHEDILALDKAMKLQVKKAIDEKLVFDPIGFGKPLQYSLQGHRRLRVGNYRIIYKIKTHTREIIISAIQHRKDVYDG
ncbi:MAG: type II toxin-antitoxin system RelE/ParE family toxin [Alphaproteobacteria bacterium]|nr:type II toxin-antitoxin system RelE/ParE family toxin [Alphaproteobacteria bacterium]OJV47121.1 MAG: addiction module antitoxin RelB [Alphaproteobacteria bacterium 43-37]